MNQWTLKRYHLLSICTIKKEQQTDKFKIIRNVAYGWEWFPRVRSCKHFARIAPVWLSRSVYGCYRTVLTPTNHPLLKCSLNIWQQKKKGQVFVMQRLCIFLLCSMASGTPRKKPSGRSNAHACMFFCLSEVCNWLIHRFINRPLVCSWFVHALYFWNLTACFNQKLD